MPRSLPDSPDDFLNLRTREVIAVAWNWKVIELCRAQLSALKLIIDSQQQDSHKALFSRLPSNESIAKKLICLTQMKLTLRALKRSTFFCHMIFMKIRRKEVRTDRKRKTNAFIKKSCRKSKIKKFQSVLVNIVRRRSHNTYLQTRPAERHNLAFRLQQLCLS